MPPPQDLILRRIAIQTQLFQNQFARLSAQLDQHPQTPDIVAAQESITAANDALQSVAEAVAPPSPVLPNPEA